MPSEQKTNSRAKRHSGGETPPPGAMGGLDEDKTSSHRKSKWSMGNKPKVKKEPVIKPGDSVTDPKVTEFLSCLIVKDSKYTGLTDLLLEEETLQAALDTICKRKGAFDIDRRFPHLIGQSLNIISKEKLQDIREDLRTGRFQFTPAKRYYVPKKDSKKRPIEVAVHID